MLEFVMVFIALNTTVALAQSPIMGYAHARVARNRDLIDQTGADGDDRYFCDGLRPMTKETTRRRLLTSAE